MKIKSEKPVTCPNCFGTGYREIMATAVSRNITLDDSVRGIPPAELAGYRRRNLVKRMCIRCGHDVSQKGSRV